MFDVTAIGELLIDMVQLGMSDIGSSIFEANPGGAPCNVLAMLNKLGRSTAFIGKVGDDIFGKKLKNIVESSGTDIGGLVFDENPHNARFCRDGRIRRQKLFFLPRSRCGYDAARR